MLIRYQRSSFTACTLQRKCRRRYIVTAASYKGLLNPNLLEISRYHASNGATFSPRLLHRAQSGARVIASPDLPFAVPLYGRFLGKAARACDITSVQELTSLARLTYRMPPQPLIEGLWLGRSVPRDPKVLLTARLFAVRVKSL